MKRKLLNGVMLLTALAGVGTLSSCKDYDSIELSQAQTNQTFQQKLASIEEQLKNVPTKDEMNNAIEARFNALKAELTATMNAALAGKVDTATFNQAMTDLNNAIDALQRKIDEIKSCECQPGDPVNPGLTEDDVKTIVEGMFGDLFKDSLAGALTPGSDIYNSLVQNVYNSVMEAVGDVAGMASRIEILEDRVRDMRNTIVSLQNQIENLKGKGLTEEQATQIAQRVAGEIVDAKVLAINNEITSIKNTITTMQATISGLQSSISSIQGDITGLKNDLQSAQTKISTLESGLQTAQNDIANLQSGLTQAQKDAIDALTKANANEQAINILNNVWVPIIQDLEGRVATLESDYANIQADMTDVKNQLATDRTDIQDLQTKYTDLANQLTKEINDVYNEINTKYDELDQKIDGVDAKIDLVNGRVDTLEDAIKALATTDALNQLADRVTKNEDAIQVLNEKVAQLMGLEDRLNKLITGVIVQGVFNPLFGSFSLPIGVQSNLLVNYVGKYDGTLALNFPSIQSHRSYNGEPILTAEEYQAILDAGFNPDNAFTANAGDYLTDGKLGKLFMTINPEGINFSGANLSLEASNGVAPKIKIDKVYRSNEQLKFGNTRANNGFYEADVVFDKSNMSASINSIKLPVVSGLGQAAKDAVKNHTAGDVFGLMKKVYDQLTVNIPAYGIKAAWTADGKNYSTYSKYEIAAVTYTPLSYVTLRDESLTDKRLPKHGPISDVLLDINKKNYHFNLDLSIKINTDDIKANFIFETIDFDFKKEDFVVNFAGVELTLEDGTKMKIVESDPVYLSEESINKFTQQMEEKINEATGRFTDDMDREFKRVLNELALEINTTVNKALEDLNTQINEKIDDIIDDIQGKINDKAAPLIDKFNKLIEAYNKAAYYINYRLEHPNVMMQPTILYMAGDHMLHDLSNYIWDPSTFSKGSGDGIELVATSYNFEILAPAYKKFLAVVAAFDANGNQVALSPSELKELNAGGHMLKVMDGSAKRFALKTSAMKPGLTYDIVYTALDYSGWTSSQHFYLKITK